MLKTIIQILFFILLTFTNSICFAQQNSIDSAIGGPILPITLIDIAGPRPVIEYLINSKNATSVIHSNASFYIHLNLQNSKYFGIEDLVENGQFGISEPGKINTKYKAKINEIKIENLIIKNKEVSIFETYPPYKEGFGMLGIQWIKENKIILDYCNNKVAIQPNKSQQDSIAKKLLNDNYISIPIQIDETSNRYYTEVVINNQKTKFLIGTVAKLFIDSAYAEVANIEIGDTLGIFGGPTGETGYVYNSKENFTIKIGAFETITNAAIEDTYKYSNKKRPDNISELIGGTLGAEFMIKNKIVIDFGNLTLYLKLNR